MLHLLKLGEILHQSIVLVLVKFELFLLSLIRSLLLLKLYRVFVHGVTVQELFVTRHTNLTTSFARGVIHGVGS